MNQYTKIEANLIILREKPIYLSLNLSPALLAWNDIQETTMSKTFQHVGFNTVYEKNQENVPDEMSEDELLINEFRK